LGGAVAAGGGVVGGDAAAGPVGWGTGEIGAVEVEGGTAGVLARGAEGALAEGEGVAAGVALTVPSSPRRVVCRARAFLRASLFSGNKPKPCSWVTVAVTSTNSLCFVARSVSVKCSVTFVILASKATMRRAPIALLW